MHKDYCNCKINNEQCGLSQSIDYDSLIERLTSTRDEIDDLIHTLKNREVKDSIINNILSSEYEDEEENEYQRILEEILKQKQIRNTNNHPKTRCHYPWWQVPPYSSNWF